jgi:putative salt-induced outer membrane protein YdiY
MSIKKIHILAIFITALLFVNSSYSQVNTEAMRRTTGEEGFTSDGSLGLSLARGNSNFLKFDASFRMDYYKKPWHIFIVTNFNRGEQSDTLYQNQGFVHLRFVRQFGSRIALEVFTQKEFDEFIRLKDRNLIGGGLRINILQKSRKMVLHQGIGLMRENEVYDDPAEREKNLLRSTNYLSAKYHVDDRVILSFTGYYQINVKSCPDYRFLIGTQFLFQLSKNFSFRVKLNYRYDNDPPSGIKKYDIELTNGIALTF